MFYIDIYLKINESNVDNLIIIDYFIIIIKEFISRIIYHSYIYIIRYLLFIFSDMLIIFHLTRDYFHI